MEWLVEVGRYVQHCWLAEENQRAAGDGKLDEQALWHLWDECTSGQLEDIRTKARLDLQKYRRKMTLRVLGAEVRRRTKPLQWLIVGASWFCLQAWKGFVSGIGLILLSLLILLLEPQLVKRVRGAFDGILPASTQPNGMPLTTPPR